MLIDNPQNSAVARYAYSSTHKVYDISTGRYRITGAFRRAARASAPGDADHSVGASVDESFEGALDAVTVSIEGHDHVLKIALAHLLHDFFEGEVSPLPGVKAHLRRPLQAGCRVLFAWRRS